MHCLNALFFPWVRLISQILWCILGMGGFFDLGAVYMELHLTLKQYSLTLPLAALQQPELVKFYYIRFLHTILVKLEFEGIVTIFNYFNAHTNCLFIMFNQIPRFRVSNSPLFLFIRASLRVCFTFKKLIIFLNILKIKVQIE